MGKRWSVAATVAVVLALAAAISLARHDDSTTSSTRPAAEPTAPVDLSGAIPWIDSSFSPEDHLKSLPTPSPPPPRPADARPCTADDVSTRFDGGNGAGGHQIFYLRFRNTSSSTCVLKGYPRVVATVSGSADIVGTNGSFFPDPGSANMEPGGETTLGLETDTYCQARPGGGGGGNLVDGLEITLPGGGTIRPGIPSGRPMDVTCGLPLTAFYVPLPTLVPDADR